MKVAINAWFWDKPAVGSGQYLKYLLPALLEADNSLEISLISPKPFDQKPETLAPYSDKNLRFITAPTPWGQQTSNLAKVWFEQITFPQACRGPEGRR